MNGQRDDFILLDLLEHGCTADELQHAISATNIHALASENEEPIHYAAYFANDTKFIDILLSAGASIEAHDEYDATPLFYAVRGKNPLILLVHLWNAETIRMLKIEDAKLLFFCCKTRQYPTNGNLRDFNADVFAVDSH
jgi:hypothetical protein